MNGGNLDLRVRLAAFEFLKTSSNVHGEVLPLPVIRQGFVFDGVRVPLVGPQGIFRSRILPEMPLSITTVPEVEGREKPYDDSFDASGFLLYRYRGEDPAHADNRGLRLAMNRRVPLIYFKGLVPGRYTYAWPVYVVRDDPGQLRFTVAVAEIDSVRQQADGADFGGEEIRREYVSRVTFRRLHQEAFRERVVQAYRIECAVCRLRHERLLDAAHIVRDSDPGGIAVVRNGMALCKLHHAAFDQNILGIRPDHVIEIREDVLLEIDGPMLKHGLQGFQGQQISVPSRPTWKPDPRLLEERYQEFRRIA